jgi:hypothetical protein
METEIDVGVMMGWNLAKLATDLRGTAWLAERLLASQEGICYVELVTAMCCIILNVSALYSEGRFQNSLQTNRHTSERKVIMFTRNNRHFKQLEGNSLT